MNIQVPGSLYTSSGYCNPARFASYAYQISEILDSNAKTVLEIGPGNGVVSYILRKANIQVETIDHDASLNPDHVASVLDMPVPVNSFDAVLCCQVLEHLPWELFKTAMHKIAKVAKKIIVISLPHVSRHYFIEFKLPRIKKKYWSCDLPPKDNSLMSFNGEHYWEIGRGITQKDVESVFCNLNLSIEASYRVPECRRHHFFRLAKNKSA